jgi:hypothetical protein
MGIFRRNGKVTVSSKTPVPEEELSDTEEEATLDRPKITMVILEFAPQFDATSPSCASDYNPTIVFRHETDSVLSDCSNCSCRFINQGRRRPDCCVACAEMRDDEKRRNALRQAMEKARDIPSLPYNITDQNLADCYSPNLQDHVLPTSIAVLSKIMINSPVVHHQHKKSVDANCPSCARLSAMRKHRQTKSLSGGGFWPTSKPTDARSLAITADLSLDHELS